MTVRKPDTRIVYRGRNHSYLLDGQDVDGVTRSLNNGFPKPALINWAAEETAVYATARWDELALLDPQERLKRLRDARFDSSRPKAERGREVHTLLEQYLHGEEVTPPDDLKLHFEQGARFVDEWMPEEIAVEAAVFSREYRYAGRLDLLARLADGRLWLLDFKTNLKGIFLETVAQLAAYRYAEFYVIEGELDQAGQAVEHPMPPVDETGVVWVRADGYDLVPVDAGPEAFAVFGAVQQVATFATSRRDDWIADALRPPEHEHDVDEAAA